MKASERMDEFFATVSYVGTEEAIRPWRDLEELATSDDEPDDPDPVPSRRKDMGGAGSGNFGHKGRPGEVGGSGEGEGGSAEDDPYALAPDAPRGGEGQGALFQYTPESGTEAALRMEAEKAITTLDGMLEDAVKDADYAGIEGDWDALDQHAQNVVIEKWADDERTNDYVEEAGEAAGREYLHGQLTPTAIFEKGMDEDLKEWLTEKGIDPESVTFDTGAGVDPRLYQSPELRINQAALRDLEGNPIGDGALFDEVELVFGREMRAATNDVRYDIEATDAYQEAVSGAENEVMRTEWDAMDDDQRLKIAGTYGMVPTIPVEHEAPGEWKFDGDMTDEDYAQTRAVALELSRSRTEDLLTERGVPPVTGFDSGVEMTNRAMSEKIADTFWSEWKRSSTSPLGVGLQMVVAEEMGVLASAHITSQQKDFGRAALREAFVTESEIKAFRVAHGEKELGPYTAERATDTAWHAEAWRITQAANADAEALGAARAKAYVRAQWETTQYVMEQAGVEEVELYRGVILPKADVGTGRGVPLPNLKLLQNAAASTTTKIDVANSWNGVGENTLSDQTKTRAVLRFKAPVSALFSIPVFGENIHEESEVVLMGTKGLQWDAYATTAPTFATVAMEPPKTTGTGKVTIVEPEVKGLRVTWSLADKKTPERPPVVVDMNTNVEGHWLVDWRKHKDHPRRKPRVVPSPHKRTADGIANVIARGMQKGMLPVMKRLKP